MDRFSISLSQEELKVVAHAVDASLCVQESLEEAETGDRVKAIDRLAGAQIMKDARYPHNIVKRCRIKLAAPGTQKRRSNWPATPEGRARVKRRGAVYTLRSSAAVLAVRAAETRLRGARVCGSDGVEWRERWDHNGAARPTSLWAWACARVGVGWGWVSSRH